MVETIYLQMGSNLESTYHDGLVLLTMGLTTISKWQRQSPKTNISFISFRAAKMLFSTAILKAYLKSFAKLVNRKYKNH